MGTMAITRCPGCRQLLDLPPGTTYICVAAKVVVPDDDLARVLKLTHRTMERGDEADAQG